MTLPADQRPDFATLVANLPDDELAFITATLTRHEPEYLKAVGGFTKFRPKIVKTARPEQQVKWFRRFAAANPEFAPVWLLAYGVEILKPIEEAALETLRITLKEQLGYDPGEPPPTAAEIAAFLQEARGAFGLAHARQWGNLFLLLMDPEAKAPVFEALEQLDWNLCTPAPAPQT
jgi:hypothetical protein